MSTHGSIRGGGGGGVQEQKILWRGRKKKCGFPGRDAERKGKGGGERWSEQ